MPDLRCLVGPSSAPGRDRVATKKTFTGTHSAPLGDLPATGRSVSLQFVDIMRVRDGRIIEHWLSMNQLSFMQQLGVIPPVP